MYSVPLNSLLDASIDIHGPVMMPLDHSSSFSLTCILTLAPQVNDTMVEMFWKSPGLFPFNFTTDGDIFIDDLEPTMISVNDSVVYTLTLNFSSLQASQVGEYICRALLNDGIDIITVSSNCSVSVLGKYLRSIFIFLFIQCIYSTHSCDRNKPQYNRTYF